MSNNFFLYSDEYYGNTDWINHIYHINKFSSYKTIFFGKGIQDGKLYYASTNYFSKNTFILFFKFMFIFYKKRKDNNVVVVRFYKYNLLIVFYLAIYRLCKFKIVYYLDVRTLYVETDNKFSKLIFDYFIKFSSLFYNNTLIINGLIAKKIHLNKYIILPLGIDNVITNNSPKNIDNEVKFVYVGKIRPEFCFFLVKFIDFINDNNLNYKLDIYSYELTDELIELIQLHNDIIFYKGKINREDIFKVLCIYHVGISPLPLSKIFDLQPHTKLYEYIQSGIPFITKNTEGVLDQFNNIIPGWVYSNYDELHLILSDIKLEYYFKQNLISSSSILTWENIYKKTLLNILK